MAVLDSNIFQAMRNHAPSPAKCQDCGVTGFIGSHPINTVNHPEDCRIITCTSAIH
jgi:hypothetical protein